MISVHTAVTEGVVTPDETFLSLLEPDLDAVGEISPNRGGTFAILRRLARLSLGGSIAGGAQNMSWLHGRDLVRCVEWFLEREDVEGPVNLAATEPRPQREFAHEILCQQAAGVSRVALRVA